MVQVTPDELYSLANEALPGPWRDSGRGLKGNEVEYEMEPGIWRTVARVQTGTPESKRRDYDARLIALAPDLARLCAELAEALRHIEGWAEDEVLHGPPELGLILGESRLALAKLSELKT